MQDLSHEHFPIPWHPTWQIMDATKLETLHRCPREFFFEYLLGWLPTEPNHDLVFGQSVHEGMSDLYKNGMSSDSATNAFKSFLNYYRKFYSMREDDIFAPKTPGAAEAMFHAYVKQFASERYKLIATEIADSVPISDKERVFFRLDAIVRFSSDSLTQDKFVVLEHKTGKTQWAFWEDQWKLKIQPKLYNHALAAMLGPELSYGTMINGLFFQKEIKFRRVPVQLNLPMLHNWVHETLSWFDYLYRQFQLLSETKPQHKQMHAFPKNSNGCVRYMHMCQFAPYCSVWSNPLQRCTTPPLGFKTRWWDPTNIDGVSQQSARDAGFDLNPAVIAIEDTRDELRHGYDNYLGRS